eukprot:gene11871-1007_t
MGFDWFDNWPDDDDPEMVIRQSVGGTPPDYSRGVADKYDGKGPLHAAALMGHERIAIELMRLGADPNMQSRWGSLYSVQRTPLHWAAVQFKTGGNAAFEGHPPYEIPEHAEPACKVSLAASLL